MTSRPIRPSRSASWTDRRERRLRGGPGRRPRPSRMMRRITGRTYGSPPRRPRRARPRAAPRPPPPRSRAARPRRPRRRRRAALIRLTGQPLRRGHGQHGLTRPALELTEGVRRGVVDHDVTVRDARRRVRPSCRSTALLRAELHDELRFVGHGGDLSQAGARLRGACPPRDWIAFADATAPALVVPGGPRLVARGAVAALAESSRGVAAPRFVRNIDTGQTGLFSSPGLVDLRADHRLEIVAPFYSTFVFDAKGRRLGEGTATEAASMRRAWSPTSTATARRSRGGRQRGDGGGVQSAPGLRSSPAGRPRPAAAGSARRHVASPGPTSMTTAASRWWRRPPTPPNRRPGLRLRHVGSAYQPQGAPSPAWPRYNTLSGRARRRLQRRRQPRLRRYGENVGVGHLDDDPQLEIVVTFDNHQINVFNHDGTSLLASRWFTNRQHDHLGSALGWGHSSAGRPAVEEEPLPPPPGPLARSDHRRGCSGRPRRRRSRTSTGTATTRSSASPTSSERALRDAGVTLHGPRRSPGRRRAVGHAPAASSAAAERQAARCGRAAIGIRPTASRLRPRRPARDRRPEIVVPSRRSRLRIWPEGSALALRLPDGAPKTSRPSR